MSSPSSSAQSARKALADQLRQIRLDAGLTARALAAAGWHEAKTSRIEHTKQAPSEADIKVWVRVCDVAGHEAELIAALRAVELMWLDWRRAERSGLKHLNAAVRELYENTKRFRIYSSVMVPGPVQTAEYVTAVLTAIRQRRGISVDDVAEYGKRHRAVYAWHPTTEQPPIPAPHPRRRGKHRASRAPKARTIKTPERSEDHCPGRDPTAQPPSRATGGTPEERAKHHALGQEERPTGGRPSRGRASARPEKRLEPQTREARQCERPCLWS
ncbi:helix-turn-helix domain-containing protein [Nonomuraea sp. NPDC059023]|uniref:helix-turn-helix domain-containing protein n=1 Tax=unclassified Nonomuraea TaxID=2593643 RepID=UPI00367AF67B